jgi:hypothetical protein
MQTEIEEWIAEKWWCIVHEHEECDCGNGFVSADDLRSLLEGKVLCAPQSIAAINRSSGEVVATLDAAYFGTNWTPLYAPADIGNLRIAAIQGAAEEYARRGNALIDTGLWDFGKEGKE